MQMTACARRRRDGEGTAEWLVLRVGLRLPPANYPLVTYVTGGIASAMAQAKAAAGDRDVLVHGAEMVQRALEAGVLDEIQIHQIPVLLGAGRLAAR